MVGKFNLGKISIGIVRTDITENSINPANSTNVVMGLFNALRTMNIILWIE